uniref:HDC14965 n=1 Tax=Drosophila melanogaster TaxID=7227 RepID=Q6IJF7_DROME|nr:TPA_inf: HDC14965 [Drosophila melanogaster]
MRAMMMTSHDCGDDDDNDDGCVNGQALFRASFPDCHTAIGEGVCVLTSSISRPQVEWLAKFAEKIDSQRSECCSDQA